MKILSLTKQANTAMHRLSHRDEPARFISASAPFVPPTRTLLPASRTCDARGDVIDLDLRNMTAMARPMPSKIKNSGLCISAISIKGQLMGKIYGSSK